jgi:hypothetical protein
MLHAFGCNLKECETPCEFTELCGGAIVLTSDGYSVDWDATRIDSVSGGLCGGSCDMPVCVDPGIYTITLCARLASSTDASCTGTEQRCASVDVTVPLTQPSISFEVAL